MAIDTSGKWWVGDRPADIEAYLRALTDDSYRSERFILSRCGCGGEQFALAADDDEGCARLTCRACRAERYLLDSAAYWGEADPKAWVCVECGSETCNVGVGMALLGGDPKPNWWSFLRVKTPNIRWAYVGCRCAKCGVLGCFADWKTDGTLSEMLNRV